jgi:anti-sigma28 factor (negative regulator of flagellin synthesis)
MRRPPAAVDDALKMTLTLHITRHDQLDQLVDRAVSSLDGELGRIAFPDPELARARTRKVMRVRTRITTGEYVIDPLAVADAIVERVRPAGPQSWLQARAA